MCDTVTTMAKEQKPPWGTTELESAIYWVRVERDWVERCGGSLAGYAQHYQDMPGEPDRVRLIYEADMAALRRAEERYKAAVEAQAKRRRRS
jgi:hypothetical protein